MAIDVVAVSSPQAHKNLFLAWTRSFDKCFAALRVGFQELKNIRVSFANIRTPRIDIEQLFGIKRRKPGLRTTLISFKVSFLSLAGINAKIEGHLEEWGRTQSREFRGNFRGAIDPAPDVAS